MKKEHVLLAAVTFVLLLVVVALLPITRDELSWHWAQSHKSIEGYDHYLQVRPKGRHAAAAAAQRDELAWSAAKAGQSLNGYWRYVQTYPQGQHLGEAQAQIEQFIWEQALSGNSVAGYENFVNQYGNSRFAPEARVRLEELKWQQAKSANTLRLLNAYLASYPRGKHLAEARKQVAALRADDQPLLAALNTQTEKALQNFLKEYPGHPQEAAARQALKDMTEGRNILELIAEKKVDAYALGNGTQTMQIKLQKLTPGSLTVRIPVGTYFDADAGSVQNMMARAERQLHLEGDFWTETDVPVVSLNFSKQVPDFDHSFKFGRLPAQSPVAALLPVLQRANPPFSVWQAACWIATDNITYEHMSVLTMHPGDFLLESVRQIQEAEAARALKLCEEAGIDISQRKIWKKSRETILRGLKDTELKKWMESKPAP